MPRSILIEKTPPYCPGCGHTLVTHHIAEALDRLYADPLDVIVVSDIGCCGLVDASLACHTLHGLHGRAAALAMGIRLGLDRPDKKVIAIQGDGGATIGLQHLLEASRRNIDMTLIVQNNMVYGMTGGQVSGLSPAELESRRTAESGARPYDVCELAHRAGAAYSSRVFVGEDSAETWIAAFSTRGFSLVEVVEMCPAYGLRKIKELHSAAPYPEVTLENPGEPMAVQRSEKPSLFESLPSIERTLKAELDTRVEIVIAGSAGEGIQSAGELLAAAGVAAGLVTTKKGDYPVTVGTGFSVAEVIISPGDIHYAGIGNPNVMVITSRDGFTKVKNRIGDHTELIVDKSLGIPSGGRTTSGDFRKLGGKRGAALAAIAFWLRRSGGLPLDALVQAAKLHAEAGRLLAVIDRAASDDRSP